MGGSSPKGPSQAEIDAVKQTDRATEMANRQREDEFYPGMIQSQRQGHDAMQLMMQNQAKQQAGYEAGMGVTQERADAIRKGGQILTDFERQEKMRLMEAKKGVGQVSEKDFGISQKDREWAESMLAKSPEYWDQRRSAAATEASGGETGFQWQAFSSPLEGQWEDILLKRGESGIDYEGKAEQLPVKGTTARTRPPEWLLGADDTGLGG